MNIFESVIDQTLNYYSQHVFDDYKTNKPKLKGRVRQKIIDDVKKIDKKIGVVEFFIKGSILTKNYSKNADIDVFVRVNANLYTEDQLRILLKPVFNEIDDTYLDGCPYPFQYYITNKKYNIENTEAVYDVLEDEWIKKSPSKNIDIDDYMDDFKKYVEQFSDFSEELRRNVIDYDILLDIPSDQIKGLRQKLDGELAEINKNIDDLSEVYKEVRDMRNEAFSEEMTPAEIKKYGIKTRLPGNVVFKLLERYYYLDLYKKIRKIIGDDGKISHSEYNELNKLLKTKLTNEKVSFKNVFGDVRGRDDLQHKPRHRQQQANAGMLGHGDRKSVNLMPDYQRSKGIKGDHAIDGAKKASRVIRVKQGTPEAIRLAKKYRIDNPVGKKIVAGNQHDQGITIIFEEFKPIKKYKSGSCMYKAEITTKKLLDKGINDFKVIEGYVSFENNKEIKLSHTWIELKNKKYDPTLDQFSKNFDITTVKYYKKKSYTPESYLNLCDKHPLNNDQKELLEQKIKRAKRILESTPKYEIYNTCVDYDDGNEVYQIVQQDEWEYPYEKTFYHNPEQQISKEKFIQQTHEEQPNGDFYGYNEEYDILFKYVADEDIHYFYHK